MLIDIFLAFILMIIFLHYLKMIEFYYKNKDKLNHPEGLNYIEESEEPPANNLSYELQERNHLDSYFYEVRKRKIKE